MEIISPYTELTWHFVWNFVIAHLFYMVLKLYVLIPQPLLDQILLESKEYITPRLTHLSKIWII